MPWSVSRSRSSSAALVTCAMLVASGRFIGADTGRTLMARIFISRSLAHEAGLALLHEGAPALAVVAARCAALDGGAHAQRIGAAGSLRVFLEDDLAVGDGERRVLA